MGMSFTEFLITESVSDFKKKPILKNNLEKLLNIFLKIAADESVDLTELDLIESISTFKDVVADKIGKFEEEDATTAETNTLWSEIESDTKEKVRLYLKTASKREGRSDPAYIGSLVNKFIRMIVKPVISDLKAMELEELVTNIKTKDRSKDADDIFGWMLQTIQQLDIRKTDSKEKTVVKKNLKRYNDEVRRSKRKSTQDRKKRVKRATKAK